jgi:hypothetical protein
MQQVSRTKGAMKDSANVDYVKQVFAYDSLMKGKTKLPLIGLKMIDFYRLKTAVERKGGYEAVSKRRNHAERPLMITNVLFPMFRCAHKRNGLTLPLNLDAYPMTQNFLIQSTTNG